MHNYSIAKVIIAFLVFAGWLAVAGGAVFILLIPTMVQRVTIGDLLFALMGPLPVMVGGFVVIAFAQVVRAQVDTAMTNAEILALLRADRNSSRPLPPTSAPKNSNASLSRRRRRSSPLWRSS